jgi:uncharacterized protein
MPGIMSEGSVEGTAPRCAAHPGSRSLRPDALETARKSVDLLLSQVLPGERVNLAFLGGEPLANRGVLHNATRYAAAQAELKQVPLTFSITTNGTLVGASDIDLFEEHGFAVTVSLDGTQDAHDRLRPFKNGAGSFARIMANIAPMLAAQHKDASLRAHNRDAAQSGPARDP